MTDSITGSPPEPGVDRPCGSACGLRTAQVEPQEAIVLPVPSADMNHGLDSVDGGGCTGGKSEERIESKTPKTSTASIAEVIKSHHKLIQLAANYDCYGRCHDRWMHQGRLPVVYDVTCC